MLTIIGVVFFGLLAVFIWLAFRAAPDHRPPAERLKNALRTRSEVAAFVAAVGMLMMLCGIILTPLLFIGGVLFTMGVVKMWLADRRERAAEAPGGEPSCEER